ncbi:protein Skeletor, isoforms B/C [Strongylocentrotus purpuratus]|uniref:Protein Skeletor n=1 Tax=Strongylocentrotus purpuratus TaxID=7668 RepID=A0A7M7NTS3_STRPU|nr:protein Skeletor, isoforms B/C [Strongylocentrotus purpuratus]
MAVSKMMVVLLAFLLHLASHADAQPAYHGKLVGSLSSYAHSVQGTVYAEDDRTLRIIGFSYDGTAPDAFLYGGETGSPSGDGFIIPKEDGTEEKLGSYSNVDITVTLPSSKTVSNLAWISVWCRQFGVDFGHVSFPSAFVPPSPYDLGALGFSPRVHGTSATAVVVLDPKKIRFENLNYDGLGPDAYFWVGPGDTPNNDGDYKIPDETGSLQIIKSYSGVNVTVTLLDNITVADIGHIGLWCVLFTEDFGHVDIPGLNVLNIPPLPLPTLTTTTSSMTTTARTTPSMEFCNCETLFVGELQVCWYIDGTDIVIRHSTPSEAGKYTAFGVSGSPTSTLMPGGDVVVTFVDDNGVAQAVDYHLGSRAQCSPQNGGGACPDVISSNSANNDVTLVESSIDNGMTHIVYRRPLAATDATYDKAISTTGPTYMIWAQGLINADGRVAYHSQRSPGNSNPQIDFNQVSSTCAPVSETTTAPSNPSDTTTTPSNPSETTPSEEEGWTIEGIMETEDATFTVEMGLTGGQQGYNYITGSVGWGIAWFINGQLIPVLTLSRGKTYTFLVSGGDEPSVNANYHPFYITDDSAGGYAQLSQDEQQNITIYAGPEEGPLCQWESTDETGSPDDYTSFEDYKNTLTVVCQSGEPGVLVWTVPMDAPDLLYYHCYTHRFLGWKIHVVDGEEGPGNPGGRVPSIAKSPPVVAAASLFASLSQYLAGLGMWLRQRA